ncbi:MAG: hypothetical protein ACI86C_001939 [Candidatus Latescibacterota bacterium]|jgi:hypothetical protein
MKIFTILALILLSDMALAISPDSEMNDELISIYNVLVSKSDGSELLGKKYSINLSLKHASEKHLIFSDAYIKIDEDTRYQIAKWQFEEHIVNSIKGKYGIPCNVTFVIKSVENLGVYSSMPHIVVEVLSVNA